MDNLIIPCAGKSSRFPNMRPKWLLTNPSGSLIIQDVIRGILSNNDFKRVIIVILREHIEKFEADVWLKQSLNNINFELCILDNPTKSQSETVFKTCKKMDISGHITVKDSDSFVVTKLVKDNGVVGADLRNHLSLSNVAGKSFIESNKSGIITSIVEKSVVSNFISVGVYLFNSAEEFMNKYVEFEDFNKGELFLSHIISSLIEDGHIFRHIQSDDYYDWGTLEDWKKFTSDKNTYFIDIDGVIFFNKGKYGNNCWGKEDRPLTNNIETIKNISNLGGQIILCTARSEEYRQSTEESLEEHGIKYHALVMGCNHAKRFLINDFSNSNSYPTALAINLERDSDDLQKYIY